MAGRYSPGDANNTVTIMKSQSIRFPDDIHEKVTRLARQEKRSINQQVILMLEKYFEITEQPADDHPVCRSANSVSRPGSNYSLV